MHDPRTEFFLSGVAGDASDIIPDSALLGLSNEQRAAAAYYFGIVALKPGALGDNLLDAISCARAVSSDPPYRRMLDRILICAPKVENLPDVQASIAVRQYAQGIEAFLVSTRQDPPSFGELWSLAESVKVPAIPPPAREFRYADNAELRRRVNAFTAKRPDYSIRINSRCWRVRGHMDAYFRCSLNGPEVAYYLTWHQEIYDLIAGMLPVGSVAKLLSLERELSEWRLRVTTPEALYSTVLPAAPTAEECEAALRLLYLVKWADGEVGPTN